MPSLFFAVTLTLAQPAADPDVLTMAQVVCGSAHPDAALTGLLTLAGKAEGVDLGQPGASALACLEDIERVPVPEGGAGPPVSPAFADALCACRTPACTFDALRRTYPGEVTAEARTRAADCLRGGYRAVLAAHAMRDAICACPDMACAKAAADATTPALLALKDVVGGKADIADIQAAGAAAAACMKKLTAPRPRKAPDTSSW